jgi:uncharacterized protein YqjF (DUF2071 family)
MSPAVAVFKADWLRAVFVHFRVDPVPLQRLVPLELDTWRGDAFVSLVAFTQWRLRPARGGRIAELLARPLAEHEFLNLRTYVRGPGDDERGIFFLAEWIPNRLAALIGPRTYGLPYRIGRLPYAGDSSSGHVNNEMQAPGAEFHCGGWFDPRAQLQSAAPATLDHFLVERYVAFTARCERLRRFRVAHAPWPLTPMRIVRLHLALPPPFDLALGGERVALAHYSPGVQDVSIGGPELNLRAARKTAAPCLRSGRRMQRLRG